MAVGGKPADKPKPYVAPQNPPTATPYKGDMNHYGEGPEWDFFQTPAVVAPPPPPPPPPKPPTGGGGGGGNPGHPFGGNGDGSQNPWNHGGGGNNGGGGGTVVPTGGGGNAANDPGVANFINILAQQGIPLGNAGLPVDKTPRNDHGGPLDVSQGAQGNQLPTTISPGALRLFQAAGGNPPAPQPQVQPPAPVMPAQPPVSSNPLTAYLQSLGVQPHVQPRGPQGLISQGSPRNMAAGGAVDPSGDDLTAQAIASLREPAPYLRGEQNQGGIGQNKTGQDLANSDVAVNPSLKSAIGIGSMVAGLATAPAVGLAMGLGKMALGAALPGGPFSSPFDVPGPRVQQDQLQTAADAYNQNLGPGSVVTNALNAYNKSIENSRSEDRAALNQQGPTPLGGYGETLDHQITGNFTSPGFSGRSAGAAGTGGGSHAGDHYGGQGGDIGSGRGDMDAGGGPEKGGLYASGGRIRHLAKGGLPRFPSIRRFAEGGAMDARNQFLDASSQSMAEPMPSPVDTTNSGAFSSQLLPFLAGAYGAQESGPLAGAASLGAATAMLGGSIHDALSGASALYRNGQQAQPRKFGGSHGDTTALLASLAQQPGAASALRAAAINPSGALALSAQPEEYSKPDVRTFRSGGNSQPIKGPGDGQSDEIPAMLSNNEHIVDAGTVAMLGNGDSDAGHKRLDEMRQLIRKNAGMKNPKKIVGKQPPVSKMLAQIGGGR